MITFQQLQDDDDDDDDDERPSFEFRWCVLLSFPLPLLLSWLLIWFLFEFLFELPFELLHQTPDDTQMPYNSSSNTVASKYTKYTTGADAS